MATIYTNQNNPATFKLIIAAHYSKLPLKSIDVQILNPQDRSVANSYKHLPYLELENGLSFFATNAAICYFLPPDEDIASKVYDWLEWEATILSPVLTQIGKLGKEVELKTEVENCLRVLNEELNNRDFLLGESVTAADISIWSVVFPLYLYYFQNPKTTRDYLLKVINVHNWVKKLTLEKPFTTATNSYIIDPSACYMALSTGMRYLSSSSASDKEPLKKQVSVSEPHSKEKESPQHTVETLTKEEIVAAEKAWQKNLDDLPKPKLTESTVLPIAGEKNILVTSALPYVNNVPHLGNIIGCVLSADVFARFSRLCNYNVLYICGTDEYGTATETKALEEGLSCQEICDKYFKIHNEIYKWFNISFDHFGRTSTPYQTELCQDMFLRLNDNGFTFTQSVEQLHCEKCDRFLADRFVEGGCPNIGCTYEDARGDQCDGCGKLVNAVELKNPRCKICGSTPKLKHSTQFFIDLPKLEPLLLHWAKLSSAGWSHNAQVITRSWLKEGLKPRCITRDLKWGVPIPLDGFRSKVFYVWFDALIGYISISKAYTKEYEKWWRPVTNSKVTLYQFMAKDNVPFHCVLFPSMLLGANRGYVTVSHVMATEYLNYESGKFSKSRGVGVFGNDAQSTGISSDVWRFYLLYIRPESQDSSFNWSDLAMKNNSELLNNLGNFVNRALIFTKNNFNYTISEMKLLVDDYQFLALCTRELKSYVSSLEKVKLRDGIRHILAISKHGNQYIQFQKPWMLVKGSDEERLRAGTINGVCCNIVCLLATLLQPYMPNTSANLKKQLNCTDMVIIPDNVEIVNLLVPGHKIGEPSPLFVKIEDAEIETLKKKFTGATDEKNNKVKTFPTKITANAVVNPDEIKRLEEEIAKQGLVVRRLKENKADRPVWQPEVDKLLILKNQLTAIVGTSAANTPKNKKWQK